MKALLIKEFRENLKWFVVGLLVFSFVAYTQLPDIRFDAPYNFGSDIEQGLLSFLGFLSALFALGLGVCQSAFDLRAGSRAYLEHRGVKSSQIVIAKIIVAFTIYAAAILIPLSLLGVYLGMVGIERIPVRPLQIVPAILAALFAFILHPIAIVCLSRCASWWGTKIVPVVAGLAVFAFTVGPVSSSTFETQIWLWVLLAYTLGLAIACWAAIDAWQKLSLNPPTGQAISNGWRVNSVLIAGSVVCSIIAIALLSPFASFFQSKERRDYKLEFDLLTGEPWAVSMRPEDLLKSNLTDEKKSGFGCKVEFDKEPKEFQLLPKKLRLLRPRATLREHLRQKMFESTHHDLVYQNANQLWTSVIDQRGFLLRYSVVDKSHPYLDSIIDREGVHAPNSLPGNPFSHLREIGDSFRALRVFFDDNGVYALQRHRSNASEMKLYQLIEGKVEMATYTSIPSRNFMRLCVVVDNELREYRLLDQDGSEEWTSSSPQKGDDGEWIENRVGELQQIRAEVAQSIAIPKSITLKDILTMLRTEKGYVVQVTSFNCKHFLLGFDGKATELPTPSSFLVTEGIDNPTNPLVPPIVGASLILQRYIYRVNRGESTELFQWIQKEKSLFLRLTCIGIAAVGLSMWLVNRMLVKRGITERRRLAWIAACIVFGIATPFMIASIYPKILREKCLACGKLRRVDSVTCEACGADWAKNERQGIEIYDRELQENPVGA